jgi:hypothetical protein
MSQSMLWDLLSPVAARMQRVVREHEILRVAASIAGKDSAKAANTARREVLKWAEKRSGGRLPEDAWQCQGFEYFSGGRNSVGLRIQNDGSDIWAIRADDPDKQVPGRVWTTEIVVGLMTGEQPRFSARLLASTPEGDLNIEPHTPGFVQQIVEKCGLRLGAYEIRPEAWLIDAEEEAENLIAMLIDQSRKLPVFVLTVPEGADNPNQPLLDASGLARAALGTGHVVILPAAFTWALTQRLGKVRSVFGGAVRAYLPGFAETANPYAHRLVLADHLSTPNGRDQCTRWMRSLAATESVRRSTLGRDVLAFAEIRSSSLAFRQQQLKHAGASDKEQLDAANARIEALERQSQDQKASLEYFDAEHQVAEERAETAEEQARGSAFRIQQLLGQLEANGGIADANVQLPEIWADFSDWSDVQLAGRVVLSPTARHAVRAPMFADVQLAARCLLWLANNCRPRRLEGGEGSLRDEIVEDGIRNSHCGEDQFDLTWQGQRYTADWHIKNGGNTRDPLRCLRIYYFWEPNTQQIVVADMPAHRRTNAT